MNKLRETPAAQWAKLSMVLAVTLFVGAIATIARAAEAEKPRESTCDNFQQYAAEITHAGKLIWGSKRPDKWPKSFENSEAVETALGLIEWELYRTNYNASCLDRFIRIQLELKGDK